MRYRIRLLRIYDLTPDTPGFRVLIDRLWPRGQCRDTLRPDLWPRELAPSDTLRKWYGHDPKRFCSFAQRYRAELAQNPCVESFLRTLLPVLQQMDVLLLYAARDEVHNQAIVLRDYLCDRLREAHCSTQG